MASAALVQALAFLLRPASTYQALALEAPAAALGAIGATFALLPLIVAVPIGRMVDQLGPGRLLVAGAGTTVLSGLVFVYGSTTLAGLFVANAILGAGHLCCVVSQQALVATGGTAHRLDAMFGYYTFMVSLGQGIGPMIIGVVGGASVQPDTSTIFGIGAVGSMLLLGLSLTTASTGRRRGREALQPRSLLILMKTPGLPRALFTSALFLSAVDITLIYLPALGAERELTAGTVGAVLTVRAVFSMLSRLLLGRLSLLMGRTRLMGTSIAVSAVSLALVATPMPTPLLMVAIAFVGLGLGVGQPLTMSWLTERAPENQRGQALALRLAGNRVGQIVIPSGLGLLGPVAGTSGVVAVTAAMVGASGLLLRGFSLDE